MAVFPPSAAQQYNPQAPDIDRPSQAYATGGRLAGVVPVAGVRNAAREIGELANELNEAINALYNDLRPILNTTSEPPPALLKKESAPPTCDLAEELKAHASLIQEAVRKISLIRSISQL